MRINENLVVPGMTSSGPTIADCDHRTDWEVRYNGFASCGFFRGSVLLPGDPEFSQIFSSAAENAYDEWEQNKVRLALDLAVRRAVNAEAALRSLAIS